MSEEEKLKRAEQAMHILNSEAFKEAMGELEAECKDTFATSGPDEKQFREDCYMMLQAIYMLRNRLQTYADETSQQKRRAEAHAITH